MSVKLISQEDKLSVFLSGEIDHHSSKQMRCEIDERITATKPTNIELNFKDVTFMDSSGIGLIMGRYKLASSYGAILSVTEVSGYLKRVMKLAGLDSIVSLNASEQRQKDKEDTK